jgi:hypothetical protein
VKPGDQTLYFHLAPRFLEDAFVFYYFRGSSWWTYSVGHRSFYGVASGRNSPELQDERQSCLPVLQNAYYEICDQ